MIDVNPLKDNAFPHLMKVGEIAKSEGGLTKREYIATAALQGILANPGAYGHVKDDVAVQRAVQLTDKLLAELELE